MFSSCSSKQALLVPEDLCHVQQSTPGVQAPPALAHDAGELEEYFAIEKCVSWRTIHDKEEGDHELYLFEVARTC